MNFYKSYFSRLVIRKLTTKENGLLYRRLGKIKLREILQRMCSVYTSQETIFSLSSGYGKCGVAVIRVSGMKAAKALKDLGHFNRLPSPRKAELRKLYDPVSGIPLDHGLVLWFPGPASFTGEDCVEFQIHGGPAVVAALSMALSKIPGVRQAEAGEFTKRAFLNNKLDLTEIEGLGDLIHAETEAQRRQALRQMEGNLGQMYSQWRSQIIKVLANVEAFIDFSEDEHLEDDILNHVVIGVNEVLDKIKSHLADNRCGERLRSGVRVTIIGEPNVGKSSLLNLISQRPAAIVSDIAGTTRDIIESAVNIGGYPVLLSDTAGLRDSNDILEKEGIKRAIQRANESDVKVIMLCASHVEHCMKQDPSFNLTTYITVILKQLGIVTTELEDRLQHAGESGVKQNDTDFIVTINKCDLVTCKEIVNIIQDTPFKISMISCSKEKGIHDFLNILKNKVKQICGDPLVGNPSLTQSRHREHLLACVSHLQKHQTYFNKGDIVLAANSLRKATREIGKITGKISSEDVLDVIFRDFCIGK